MQRNACSHNIWYTLIKNENSKRQYGHHKAVGWNGELSWALLSSAMLCLAQHQHQHRLSTSTAPAPSANESGFLQNTYAVSLPNLRKNVTKKIIWNIWHTTRIQHSLLNPWSNQLEVFAAEFKFSDQTGSAGAMALYVSADLNLFRIRSQKYSATTFKNTNMLCTWGKG